MKIVLIVLSGIGALVCIISAMAATDTLKGGGRVEVAVVLRMIGGAAWAAAALYLMKHPEWQTYLEEKF